AGRSYKTEAVVLRSFRLGEADRVLHLYTRERGRIGAVAKGVRKTKSRFGGRLEPLSHVDLMLHQGGGELQTVTGAELVRSHRLVRVPRRLPPADAQRLTQRLLVLAVPDVLGDELFERLELLEQLLGRDLALGRRRAEEPGGGFDGGLPGDLVDGLVVAAVRV